MSPHPRSRATPRTTRSAAALAALVVTLTVSACTPPEDLPEVNTSLQNAANQQSAGSTPTGSANDSASPETGDPAPSGPDSANGSGSPATGEPAPSKRDVVDGSDSLETGEPAPPKDDSANGSGSPGTGEPAPSRGDSATGSGSPETDDSDSPETDDSAAPSTSGSAAPSTSRSAAPSTTDPADGDSDSSAPDPDDAGPRPITELPPTKGGRYLFVDSKNGNDNSDGAEARPLKTPQAAARLTKPGDVVVLRAGDHSPFTVTTSGTPGKPIVYTAEPRKTVRVVMDPKVFNGVKVEASHITLQGVHVVGLAKTISLDFARSQQDNRSNPLTNGNCVTISSNRKNAGFTPTDVTVTDVKATDCAGAGITSINSDRIKIAFSLVEGSSKYSVFGTSPIGFLSPTDTPGDSWMIFQNNISQNNLQLIRWIDNPRGDTLTEGHGFSLDRGDGYKGKIEVKFNVSRNNGGSGIQCLKVSNVEIVGNTTSDNVANLPNGSEISILTCSDILGENNRMDPRDGRQGFFFTRSSTDVVEKNNQVVGR